MEKGEVWGGEKTAQSKEERKQKRAVSPGGGGFKKKECSSRVMATLYRLIRRSKPGKRGGRRSEGGERK